MLKSEIKSPPGNRTRGLRLTGNKHGDFQSVYVPITLRSICGTTFRDLGFDSRVEILFPIFAAELSVITD